MPAGAMKARLWTAVLAAMLVAWGAVAAYAHFRLNLNVRIFHVEHLSDGLRIYIRLPMPYLLADKVGKAVEGGLPEPAPFTTNKMENGKLVHYVDFSAMRRNSHSLGRFAASGHHIVVDGTRPEPTVEQVQIYRVGSEPDFATLGEAKAAFIGQSALPDPAAPLYVGDSVVDVILHFPINGSVDAYSLSSSLDPGLPGQEDTANLVLDYAPGGTQVFRARGLLNEPIMISRSVMSAVITFVEEGVRHILEGLDHVLFVVCLVLGATQLKSLIWRVTGFTIGHSVTLSAGFFGFVPSGAWFVPTVEMGIALTIIYAAVIAVMPQSDQHKSERGMFFVTCAIGLLHGLGFSFVLHKILRVDSPDIWQSLLAFNIGVEFGQLAIILVTWPLFRFIERLNSRAWNVTRWGVAVGCAAIATFWTGERAINLMTDMRQSSVEYGSIWKGDTAPIVRRSS